jgi:hypothetical protein
MPWFTDGLECALVARDVIMLCCWSVFRLRVYPQVLRLVRIDDLIYDLTYTFSNIPKKEIASMDAQQCNY